MPGEQQVLKADIDDQKEHIAVVFTAQSAIKFEATEKGGLRSDL